MNQPDWHSLDSKKTLELLHSHETGLLKNEVKHRLVEYGLNQIESERKKNIFYRLANQFNNILIYILLIAALITLLLQNYIDMIVILGVVFLNALIGFIQEGKAQKAIASLKKMISLQANVLRNGKHEKIDAESVVPGDIVFLHSGTKVPADLRLIKSHNLQIDEAILTGESLPQDKNTEPLPENTPLAERHCMAYSGTFVTYGNGVGVVVHTGKKTEIGRISSMLSSFSALSTPLLRQMQIFGRRLAIIVLTISAFLFLFGFFIRHYPINEIFMAAVAFSVSIIPEGLPAIITITLAIGVVRMARRNAIIRRLPSVETLSCVTVICTDKTGTLTKNELTVQTAITPLAYYEISGSGYNDSGQITKNKKSVHINENPDLSLLIQAGILCNEAELHSENQKWKLIGSPMDGALLSLGLKAKLDLKKERALFHTTDTIPFDSSYKYMATLQHDHKGHAVIFVKGAPEKIIAMCENTINKTEWLQKVEQLAQKGMRILALSYRKVDKQKTNLTFQEIENSLSFLGIVGIIDPPRDEVKQAVKTCQQSGIAVKMISGDHAITAKAIGKQVGILSEKVLTGEEIDQLDDKALAEKIKTVNIFARTIPEHKRRLINALRANGDIMAMTGDGVNDAPALQEADIGIAMGIKGTDVAKEAAEMVLADDNFNSIEKAIEEARHVYTNLKKAILFILPSSAGEGFAIFFAILFGYTLPITPLQVLWVNMITTVTLALAIAFEKKEKNLMRQKPRHPNEPLLSRFLLWRTSFVTFLFVISLFGLFIYEITQGTTIQAAQTMVVNLLVLLESMYLLNCRYIYDSVINKEGFLGSFSVLIAIGLVILFQMAFTYLPFMQYFFNTQAINFHEWAQLIAIALMVFFIIELEKWLFRFKKIM